mmetsp:Transcript_80645/g.213738  ORF Transcript_80645/g.213738 Transcript_80645/m.213738 type:complete len:597 (+) Transcript_80645:53-1843(+)
MLLLNRVAKLAQGSAELAVGSAAATLESLQGAVSIGDWVVVSIYLIILLVVTLYCNRAVGAKDAEHFFLGGRSMPWWAIGCSLFASNVGTDHLVGLAGTGASSGLAVGLYEWNAAFILIVLGWCFVPRYLAYEIYTVPEYLERRFSKGFRNFFLTLSLASAFFTKITVTLYAGAVVLVEVCGFNMWLSSVVLLVLTAMYTSFGGLAAVLYTEVLQVVVLLFGTCALLFYGLDEVGGWPGLEAKLPAGYFHLVRPLSDPDFPWLGCLLGMPINSIWYWCTDQVMVQRVLATNRPAVAQRGCVLAAWLKILPMYLMVLPGMIAMALYPDEVSEDTDSAFAVLVVNLLPHGWKGVMIAAMLSSFMAALASCFNSCSTLFTMVVYRSHNPDADEAQMVFVGRMFTLVVAVVSLLWLPVIANNGDGLFLYIQNVSAIWCGPIAVVFLGSLWPSFSTENAWVTTCSGLLLGCAYSVVHDVFSESQLPGWLLPVHGLNCMHFAIIIFAACAAVMASFHAAEGRRLPAPWAEGGASEALAGLGREEDKLKAVLEREVDERYRKQEWAGAWWQALAALVAMVVVGLVALHEEVLAPRAFDPLVAR